MGTRADFYVGRGEKAKWLGSIAWDGYPDGIGKKILETKTIKDYTKQVSVFLLGREDGTFPKDGWPWPWEDSHTTDYAYAFDKGKVWAASGKKWFDPLLPKSEEEDGPSEVVFPNMKKRQKVTLGKRSGLLVFTAPKK